ncbi:MAG: hypothetical protein ACFFBH_16450 [Promethearchaeota archaeon]
MVNTIMMLLFSSNSLTLLPGTTIDFWEYQRYWWTHTGILMIIIVAIGVALILIGIWYIRISGRRQEV